MWIQTYTGKKMFPLAPKREDICIEDIAHALSMKCRFNGHCNLFYSIAQHSLIVASLVKPELRLAALLHDAAEAYLPDFCRPIKGEAYFRLNKPRTAYGADGKAHKIDTDSEELAYRVQVRGEDMITECYTGVHSAAFAEEQLMSVIWYVFDAQGHDAAAIKQADLIALATEARDLMGKPPEPWALDVPLLPDPIEPMTPDQAEAAFLDKFRILTKGQSIEEVIGIPVGSM